MNITDIINRIQPAIPWDHEAPIPWSDPEFSARMLKNHLSQDHDWASRREEIIQAHVKYIDKLLAPGSHILDMTCGPGFYTQMLAKMGHHCLGVDFSPASIDYARAQASEAGLAQASYELSDIRKFTTEKIFDCVLFVFGEFNVFSRSDAQGLLNQVARVLKPGGLLILEAQTLKSVKESGEAPSSWWSCASGEGILSDRPNVCLQENYWDQELNTATTRYYVLDGATGGLSTFCSSMTAYASGSYEKILGEAGFSKCQFLSRKQWPVGPPFEGVMMTMVSCKK